MKRSTLILTLAVVGTFAAFSQSYDDDIYYNPKKDKTVTKQKKQSNYIADMGSMDVDTYNRRGQYYMSPVDTIGAGVSQGDDFVYTQQIQKYYNPTIVVDNADILDDVLMNSYGNVDIQISNSGVPVLVPYNSYYSYAWPSYSWSWGFGPLSWSVGYYDPWWGYNPYWGPSYSWGWGPSWSWAWGPSYSWGWGPSYAWGWGPSWSWGWGGPGWGPGWGPGHGPGHGPNRPVATVRPGGSTVSPSAGWAGSTRPGSSTAGHRGTITNNNTSNFGGNTVNGHRTGGVVTNPAGGTSHRGTSAVGGTTSGNRVVSGGSNTTVNRGTSTVNTTNRNTTNHRGNSSVSTSRSNSSSNRSSGSSVRSGSTSRSSGSFGGGSSRGGGGTTRGGGGGGHR